MNINFVLNGLSTTVDGNPINIEHAEISCELSTQEIATGGGLISALSREFKPLLKEAIKPQRVAPQAQSTEPVVRRVSEVEVKPSKAINTTVHDEPKDLSKCFREISIPEAMKLKGFKTWEWKDSPKSTGKLVEVSAADANHIMVSIKVGGTWVYVHIRPDNTTINGVTPEDLTEFLKFAELPEELQEYILKVVAL